MEERSDQEPKVKHVQFSRHNKLDYGLSGKPIDQFICAKEENNII